MVNDLIKGALLGVFGYIWYYAATGIPYLANESGDVGSGYIFFTIVAAALLAGK